MMDALLPISEPMAADPIPAAVAVTTDYDMGEGEAEDHSMIDDQAQHVHDEGMQDEEYGAEGIMEHEEHVHTHEADMDGMAEADGTQEHDMVDEDGEQAHDGQPGAEEIQSYESVAVTATEGGDVVTDQVQEEVAEEETLDSAPAPSADRKSLADAPPLGEEGLATEGAPDADAPASLSVDTAQMIQVVDASEEAEHVEVAPAAEEQVDHVDKTNEATNQVDIPAGANAEAEAESSASAAHNTVAPPAVPEAATTGEAADEREEEDEPAVPACRLTFDEQDFVIFSSSDVPSYATYATEDEGADVGLPIVIQAPPLAVPFDVFDKPLDELFKAFRVKDSLGDFLQEGTELEVLLVDLDLAIREDDRNARDIRLSDLYRIHKGLGLESSMHLIVSEAGDRFITRYHHLAAQVDSNASVASEVQIQGDAPEQLNEADAQEAPAEPESHATENSTALEVAEPVARDDGHVEDATEGVEDAAEDAEAHDEAAHEDDQTFVTVQEEGDERDEGEEEDVEERAAGADFEADETVEGAEHQGGEAEETEETEGGWEDGEAAEVEGELAEHDVQDDGEEDQEGGEEEDQEGEYEAYQPEEGQEEGQNDEEEVAETDEQLVDYEEAVPEGEGGDADADAEEEDSQVHISATAAAASLSTKRPLEDEEEGSAGEDAPQSNGTEEGESKRVKVA